MLSVRSAKDVVGGQLLLRFCETVIVVLGLTIAFFSGLSVALGTPAPILGGVVAALIVNTLGVTIGYPIGLALKGVFKRYRTLYRYWYVLFLPPAVGYFVFLYAGGVRIVITYLEPIALQSPVGWLTDLALITTPGTGADPLFALGTMVITIIICTAGLIGSVSAASYTWYTHKKYNRFGTDNRSDPQTEITPIGWIISAITGSQATLGIAEVAIRRAYRAPYLLLLGGIVLLGAIPIVEQLLTKGTIPWFIPWAVVLYGAWLAGTVVPLNVLGSQGRVLPALLTSQADGRRIATGHIIGGAAPFVPVTTLFAVLTGLIAGWQLLEIATLVVVAPSVVLMAVTVATGIGVRFPRYRSVDIEGADGIIPPHKVASAVLSIWTLITVVTITHVVDSRAIEGGGLLIAMIFPVGASTGATVILVIATVGVLVLGGSAIVSYRYAWRRIDSYEID